MAARRSLTTSTLCAARAALARRLFSLAVRDEDPRERMAELGDAGFIQFTVDESAGLVRVYDLVWIG